MTGIRFQSVSKRYDTRGKPAVDDISFEVAKGSLTTLLGPSGCGKTTTLRMIAGLETPTAGRILIDGRDVTPLGPAQRSVSLVFQSYALFPHMSVLENVAYGPSVAGAPREAAHAQAAQALALVGLQGYESRMPAALSGGQQQRVALARALVLKPSVLLLDEPLSNLDARLRRQMREEIRSLQQRLGLTVVYVTHDQAEALAVSDRIIVMNEGRIAQHGAPRQLYEQPASAFVAGFMGEALLLRAHRRGADYWLDRLPVPAQLTDGQQAGQITLAIRPEAWQILPAGPLDAAAPGLPGTVRRVTYLGGSHEVTVDTVLGEVFMNTPLQAGAPLPGSAVLLRLAAQGVAVLSDEPGAGAARS